MAKTCEKKVEIADRILTFTREYGLPDHDVFLDCLTFTLASGDEEFRSAGIETIEAIREIKAKHPLVNFTLGISNISFGLKPAARAVVNSAFLHYALEVGLTSAIVHFSKILPSNRIETEIWKIASDLVFDRREFVGV
jgi:5-methyltetrahydrofolate--homocysteine methyltransferase